MIKQRLQWIYRAWRYRLKLERLEIAWVLGHLGPGDTAIDVGAHKGAYTYWMRRAVGPAGRVIAFEPQPELAQRLKALLAGSGHRNVTVETQGLSSSAGRLQLRIPGHGSSPSASFERTQDASRPGQVITVPVTTLDEYLGPGSGLRIRLLKCDAEGHELQVFRGAEQLLRRDSPDLLFECEARHRGGVSPVEVFEFLQQLGYRGYGLGRSGMFDLEDFDVAVHQGRPGGADYVNNFCFTRDPREAGGAG